MSIIKQVEDFYGKYSGEKEIIGYSVNNLPIYSFAVKKTARPIILVQGAIHAREYVTAKVILSLAKDFNKKANVGKVYFLPITNPDGVKIALYKDGKYKANAHGVDLNVNFPAKWGKGKSNVFVSGAENYVGETPLSEPETRALCDFTIKVKPDMTISYHSKGEEIYFEFNQRGKRLERDFYLASIASKITGYPIKSTKGSCGGYKDWCVQKLKIPALTIEVGDDRLSHPIGLEHEREITRKNIGVLKELTEGLLKWSKNL